jgi:hypothetical protein
MALTLVSPQTVKKTKWLQMQAADRLSHVYRRQSAIQVRHWSGLFSHVPPPPPPTENGKFGKKKGQRTPSRYVDFITILLVHRRNVSSPKNSMAQWTQNKTADVKQHASELLCIRFLIFHCHTAFHISEVTIHWILNWNEKHSFWRTFIQTKCFLSPAQIITYDTEVVKWIC